MIIFPAIDIKDGKVVRLRQGQFDKVTEYSDDPLSVAKKWVDEGASWLHIVDLDGAQTGEIKNFDLIARVAKNVKASLQVGGGIRTEADINRFLKAGVRRVILGTKVFKTDFVSLGRTDRGQHGLRRRFRRAKRMDIDDAIESLGFRQRIRNVGP
jgi:phosphoribosylformimino-5-aminoimidazole carboxamide ribotide isomerase